MSVWYCEELDALVIRHPLSIVIKHPLSIVIKHPLSIDNQTWLTVVSVEWDVPDMIRAKELRSKYKGVADLADLFTWKKIGDFD